MRSIRPAFALSIVGALSLAACGGDDEADEPTVVTATINVGRTTDPVSGLLAEIYGQGLENAGYRIGRKDPVDGREVAYERLVAGTTDFVPESTFSLLTYVGGTTGTAVTAATTADQVTALTEQLPDTLTIGEPSGVDVGLVVACSQAAVAEHSLASISDLAGVASDVTLGVSDEFEAAEAFGLAALEEVYDADFTTEVVTTDQVGEALADGTVDCAVVSSMLAAITIDGLLTLDDDQDFAPDDVIVPLLTVDAGQADVLAVLTAINANLSTDVVRALLVKAEVSGDPFDVVAKGFLASVSASG